MHIEHIDDSTLIIYLSNTKAENLNLEVRDEIELYFKKIFNELKKLFNIEIKGYYNINVYKDKFYGLVIELRQEDIEYIDYFDNQVEMNITIINKDFIYKVDDYFFVGRDLKDNIKLYNYKNNIFVQIIENISDINKAKLLEFSNLIYSNDADIVLKKGKILEI